MVTSSNEKQIEIQASVIIFGALIGIGFWVTLGTFGGALSMTLDFDDTKLPSLGVLAVIACLATIVLSSPFLAAGYIVSRAAHQQFRFDAIVHSLGTWAVMAILLFLLIMTAALGNGIYKTFSGINPPALITDVKLFEGQAVTTLKGKTDKEKPTLEEKKVNKIVQLAWWVAFASLCLGLILSVIGGLLGRQRPSEAVGVKN